MSYLVLEDFKLSKNFWLSEFQCNNPKKNPKEILIANGNDINKLQKIRDYFNKPLNICVSYRDPVHNQNVGGDPNSNHIKGEAFDIKVGKNDGSMPEVESPLMAYIAWKCGFNGVGIYDTFTHVDKNNRLFNKSSLYKDIKTYNNLEKYIIEKYGKISFEEIKQPIETETSNYLQHETLVFKLTKIQKKYDQLKSNYDDLLFENMNLNDELKKYVNIENSLGYKIGILIDNIIKYLRGK